MKPQPINTERHHMLQDVIAEEKTCNPRRLPAFLRLEQIMTMETKWKPLSAKPGISFVTVNYLLPNIGEILRFFAGRSGNKPRLYQDVAGIVETRRGGMA